jgi:hypothetical protein
MRLSYSILVSSLAVGLALSCAAKSVTGFDWKDRSGASLAFSQSAARPEGAEGRFGPKDKVDRYIPRKALNLDSGEALVIDLKLSGSSGGEARVSVVASSRADGASSLAKASFPLRTESTRIFLPFAAASRVASLTLRAEEGELSIESIRVARAFRGMDESSSPLRVSSGFGLSLSAGGEELEIEKPFAGLRSPQAGEGGPGLLISYAKAPLGSALRIRALLPGGEERAYRLRCRPSGTTTVLDEGLIPANAEKVILSAPKGVSMLAFYSAELPPPDYELADLGRVLLDDAPAGEYSLYRWDMLPSVLVFDFKDYATQDRYMKRLAFFVEKVGYRGVLAKDEEIAPLHGWNAHDYRAEDLAAFFQAARAKSFPLGKEEKDLESLLLSSGIIKEEGGELEPGSGAIISVSHETEEGLRWKLAVHESTHGILFVDPDYRRFVQGLWASIDPGEKWFWRTYLGWALYDISSSYLISNEFQAYLLQQPPNAAREYFEKRKSSELLEKHPEMQEKVDAYMAEYGDRFEERAKDLESWLYAKYAVRAGGTVFLSRSHS